jgi:hypothetical protein
LGLSAGKPGLGLRRGLTGLEEVRLGMLRGWLVGLLEGT